MAANERSFLLPHHRVGDDEAPVLHEEEDDRKGCHVLKTRYYAGAALLSVCLVLGVGSSPIFHRRNRDVNSSVPEHVVRTSSHDDDNDERLSTTAGFALVDEQIDQWEAWKRQLSSGSAAVVVDSLTSLHVQTAAEILAWESSLEGQEMSNAAIILKDTNHDRLLAEVDRLNPMKEDKASLKQQLTSASQSKLDSLGEDVKALREDAEAFKDDAELELRTFLQTSGETVDKAYSNTQSFKDDAEQGLRTFVQTSGETVNKAYSNTQSFLNSTLEGVEKEPWWDGMSDWFKSTWTAFSDEAHTAWLNIVSSAREGEEKLWDATVHNERIWYAASITNMRRLGTNMLDWWDDMEGGEEQRIYRDDMAMSFYQARLGSELNTSMQDDDEVSYQKNFEAWMNSTDEEETAIQTNFADWWNATKESERIWWSNTRKAFKAFTHEAGEKTKLWWSMVKHSVKEGWNNTEEGTKRFFNEANQEAKDRFAYTRHEIVSESKAVWNSTVEAEERMWNAIQRWFTYHATYVEELSQPNLYLNSTATFSMMTNGYGWFDYSSDYFLLQQGWDAQINQAYCAVASCAAVLNSFQSDVAPPVDPMYTPYHYATQIGILSNSCVNNNVVRYNASFDGIFHAPGGLSLLQAKELLQCHLPKNNFDILLRYVDPQKIDLDKFRQELEEALRDPRARIIINFDRKGLDQIGGGHFSPLAGYYDAEDRFLIMDVAKYKYPAVWVTAARLYASLATMDGCGESDVPLGQDSLPTMTKKDYEDQEKYMQMLAQLNCQPRYRGYIIVRAKGPLTQG